MDTILTVGFILAVTAFFTKAFGLKGYQSFAAAILVAVIAAEYPVFLTAFPTTQVWLDPVATVLALAIAAAGTYDWTKELSTNKTPSTTTLV